MGLEESLGENELKYTIDWFGWIVRRSIRHDLIYHVAGQNPMQIWSNTTLIRTRQQKSDCASFDSPKSGLGQFCQPKSGLGQFSPGKRQSKTSQEHDFFIWNQN